MPAPWIISRDRAIVLFDHHGRAPRGRHATRLPAVWPDKAAGDRLDYTLDCRKWLATTAGDAIASWAVTMLPSDMTAPLVVDVGGLLIVWLAGGTPGRAYAVTVSLTSAAGQTASETIALSVPAWPVPAGPPVPEWTDDSGAPVTDDSGAPVTLTDGALADAAASDDGLALTDGDGDPLLLS